MWNTQRQVRNPSLILYFFPSIRPAAASNLISYFFTLYLIITCINYRRLIVEHTTDHRTLFYFRFSSFLYYLLFISFFLRFFSSFSSYFSFFVLISSLHFLFLFFFFLACYFFFLLFLLSFFLHTSR